MPARPRKPRRKPWKPCSDPNNPITPMDEVRGTGTHSFAQAAAGGTLCWMSEHARFVRRLTFNTHPTVPVRWRRPFLPRRHPPSPFPLPLQPAPRMPMRSRRRRSWCRLRRPHSCDSAISTRCPPSPETSPLAPSHVQPQPARRMHRLHRPPRCLPTASWTMEVLRAHSACRSCRGSLTACARRNPTGTLRSASDRAIGT